MPNGASDGPARDGELVERMFPDVVEHGIARDDRAVANVRSGVDTAATGDWGSQRWYEGGGRIGEKAFKDIVVYPPTRGLVSQGDPFEPVKIGILVDMELGQLLADWIDATILALEDALNEGVYDRPVRLVVADARGLPRENYLKVRDGIRVALRRGLRGGARSDDLRQLAQHPGAGQPA